MLPPNTTSCIFSGAPMFHEPSLFRAFRHNVGGNLSVVAALVAVPLLAASGAAIDYGRLHTTRIEVKSAMDAAVLAGTRALMEGSSQANAKSTAEKYFASNLTDPSQLLNSTIAFKVNATGTGVEASGNADLATTFMSVVNIKTMALFPDAGSAGSSAEVGTAGPGGDLEISLMLDVTGSMCDDGVGPCTASAKMTALKAAATKLVDTVVWDDQSKYTSKVAVVPFSTRVRVAQDGTNSDTMNKLTNLGPPWSGYYKTCTASTGGGGSEDNGNWTCTKYSTVYYNNWKVMPCVTDRFYDASWSFELTDTAPGPGYYLNAHDGSRMTLGPDSSTKTATSGLGAKKSDPATNWNYEPNGICYDVANADEIMPLNNDRTSLKAKINGLEAYGATSGVLGTAFSWYMLSPGWKDIWTGQSQPKDYSLLAAKNSAGKPKLRKIAILMTDGVYNTFRGWKDQDKSVLSTSAIAMCQAMKAKGIEIYTVGFALNELTSADKAIAEATLKTCGTDIDHFYQSINIDQLQAAFKSIGNKVAETSVRLTK
jgi:Flp pilus assembly protein TadG